jgi:hypothetical protein
MPALPHQGHLIVTQRTRKFFGILATLFGLAVYCLIATLIYETLLLGLPPLLLIVYFAIAGIGWIFPAMAIIRFMARPD